MRHTDERRSAKDYPHTNVVKSEGVITEEETG